MKRMQNMKTIKEAVWKYYNAGFSIIPLGVEGNLKAPSIKEWKKYQKIRPTKEEIDTWLKEGLFVGIGIIGGKVSHNLAVIDFDDESLIEEAGLDLKAIIKRGNWVVKTGKGYHIYCRGTEPVKTRKAAIVSMDLKADKGYVAAPPSPHESGVQYEFLNDKFNTIPPMDVMSWFNEIVETVKQVRDIKPEPVKAKEQQSSDGDPECISLMMEGAEKGRRNETLYALTNYYKNIKTLSMNIIEVLLHKWNDSLEQPMPSSEVDATIKSAFESDTSTGCSSIMDLGYCPYASNKSECPFYTPHKESYQPLLLKYKVVEVNKKGRITKVCYPNLGELIKTEHDFNFIVIRDESTDKKTIFAYEDGYYNRKGKDYIKHLVHKYLGELATIKAKEETISAIIDTSPTLDRAAVEPDKRFINFNNGIFDLETEKLLPHSPTFKFLQKIPTNYIPGSKCDKIIKFMLEVVDKKDLDVIQEMFGYCMYRGYNINAAFILFGTGRNGKGVMTNLLRKLIGEKNVCSRKLHEITEDTFAKADLYGRLANICGEMEGNTLKQTGNLKELTGEDWVTAQRKYHGSFQFQNYAKLIFSTNSVPKTTDSSYGFYDRMKIIQFTRIFNADNPKTDSKLFEHLSDRSSMEGLAIWSLEGLKRLLKQHKFSNSETLESIGASYDEAVHGVWHWFEDNVTYDSAGLFTPILEIFNTFTQWCKKNNKPLIPYNNFAKQLYGYSQQIGGQKCRQRVDGERQYGYKYMKLEEQE